MFLKIKRAECFEQYPKFPWSKYQGNKYFFPERYKSSIITLHSKTAKTHAKNIGAALRLLLKGMGIDRLVFVGDSTLPWLFRCDKFEYKPVQDAFSYLKANKVSKTFNGGLMVETSDIAEFIQHMFWLTRTNGIIQFVHAMDELQQIVLRVCQHGNIHFDTLDEATDKLFNELLPFTGLHLLDTSVCYKPFGNQGKIGHSKAAV